MIQTAIPCDKRNYGGTRRGISYLVVHYTAGDGDTARDNGLYFSRNAVGASAHWFVDQREAVLSVPEEQVAWHCGAAVYVHPTCRNANSIGVELCSVIRDGVYQIPAQTLQNAIVLLRNLMKKYRIPPERVIRHYDVTGKKCPAPLVEAGEWKEFLKMLTQYDTLEETPAWAQATIGKLMERGWLGGTGKGLALSEDMVRILVILDRAGVFETAGESPAASL